MSLFENFTRTLNDAAKTAGNTIRSAADSVAGAAIQKVANAIEGEANKFTRFDSKEQKAVDSAKVPGTGLSSASLVIFAILAFVLIRKARVS